MIVATVQRLAQMLFVMFGISVLVFLIFFATPGTDPAARLAGRNAAQSTVIQIRHEFGFDRPLPVQYAIMMKKLFITQDLTSFVNRGQKVVPTIERAAPATVSLVFGAAHFQWGLIGVVQTACMGLALGISYRVLKRNLWILVVAHAYMDTILFVQMYLPARP